MSDFQKIKPNYVHLSRRAIKHFQARRKKKTVKIFYMHLNMYEAYLFMAITDLIAIG